MRALRGQRKLDGDRHASDTRYMGRHITIAFACIFTAATVHAAEQTVRIARLSVTVWPDNGTSTAPQPTIIFSHGFHGCSTQSRFLMDALARAGYLVFAPNHRDATCKGGEARWTGRPDVPFNRPETWNETSYRDRGNDIRRLIEALRSDERFKARVDWSRVGLAGHSLGGYTVLALAGAWSGWRLDGIRAVLALSPYTQPFERHRTVSQLSIPVMYQGGTRDFGVTPTLHKSMGTYDQSPEPKYYIEFEGAGHYAWTNISRTARESIVAYSLAFLNQYVKGDAASGQLTQKRSDVALLRYASKSGRSDPERPRGVR
jgi:predicted dienelactone hydrolase